MPEEPRPAGGQVGPPRSAAVAPPVWVPGALQQGELVITGLFLVAVVGSILLEPSAEGVRLLGVRLPATCLFRAVTGWRCPGCGLTRAFAYMGHGQVVEAFRVHWLGPPFYLFSVGFLVWRLVQLARALRTWWSKGHPPRFGRNTRPGM